MNEEEAIEYLKNYKYDNEVKESIEIVLNLLEKKDNKIALLEQLYKKLQNDFDNFKKDNECKVKITNDFKQGLKVFPRQILIQKDKYTVEEMKRIEKEEMGYNKER